MVACLNLLVVLVVVCASVSGCAEKAVGTEDGVKTDVCRRLDDALSRVATVITIDDEFEVAARFLPGGFAGVFLGSSGTSTISLTQPDSSLSARTVASQGAGCPNGGRVPTLKLIASAGAVTRANYDFLELRGWYRQMGSAGVSTFGLVYSDIDEANNRLSFGVRDTQSQAGIIGLAASLGVPTAAINVFVASVSG